MNWILQFCATLWTRAGPGKPRLQCWPNLETRLSRNGEYKKSSEFSREENVAVAFNEGDKCLQNNFFFTVDSYFAKMFVWLNIGEYT